MTDKRMEVVLGLMPADAVFVRVNSCVYLEDGLGRHRWGAALWRSAVSRVSADNPWQAGIYTTSDLHDVDPNRYSYVVPVNEYLGGRVIQEGTPIAVLVDEIVKLRDDVYHARVFAALAIEGYLSESHPVPWTAARIDAYHGPNTEHAWAIFDDVGECIQHLSACVDGPAFVDWINRTATLTTLFLTKVPP